MCASCTCLTDGLKNLLDQLELIRGKRIVLDEVVGISELTEGHSAIFESQLILEDVPFAYKNGFEIRLYVWPLRQ